jgi:hypothetical protein
MALLNLVRRTWVGPLTAGFVLGTLTFFSNVQA